MLSDHIYVEQSKTLSIRYKGDINHMTSDDAEQTSARISGTSLRRSSLASISSSGLGGSSDGICKNISWQQRFLKSMKNGNNYCKTREPKPSKFTSNMGVKICILRSGCSARDPRKPEHSSASWQITLIHVRQWKSTHYPNCIPNNVDLK